jgi:Fe-S cluster biogenesis protein NfuA
LSSAVSDEAVVDGKERRLNMSKEKVEKVLSEEVSPLLATHGGGVELVEVTQDMVVKVKLTGMCSGCPGARMTVTGIVEKALKSRMPEVKRVEAV